VLRKRAQIGFVWLTALLTLVAGSPHVRCVCPSGQVKPFCLGFLFHGGTTGGCCAADTPASPAGCCDLPHPPPAGEDVPCCCSHGPKEAACEASLAACVAAVPCTRTLEKAVEFVPVPWAAGVAVALACNSFLAPGGLTGAPSDAKGLPSWQGHSLAPPPTDLVTILQRLTI
jgi:hypothetical protein